MRFNVDSVTVDQVEALRERAGKEGAEAVVRDCSEALTGNPEAINRVVDVLNMGEAVWSAKAGA